MSTKIQERVQCDGPHRPVVEKLLALIHNNVPAHLEIAAISIIGQTGTIIVECIHEGLDLQYEIDATIK